MGAVDAVECALSRTGDRRGFGDACGMKFAGVLGYLMWGFRLGTLDTWARALAFSSDRGHRIITLPQATLRAHERSSGP